MNRQTTPLVSVIVPCYNYGRFLGYTLQSILNNELRDWECIIVDDGSTDDTEIVAKEYAAKDSRIRYYYQQNGGLSAARNSGLELSSGKYIQLLDADDAIHQNKLKLQAQYLEQHQEADIVYGNTRYFNTRTPDRIEDQRTDHPAKHHKRHQQVADGKKALMMLTVNNIMDCASPMLRRELMEKVGKFDTSYTSYEDWQYWIRCALAGATFHYWPENGTEPFIRYGHASMMSNLGRMNENGLRIRQFLHSRLPISLKLYNSYRILKLLTKKLLLSLQGK